MYLDIVLTIVVAILLLLVEHYWPWRKITGRDLPRPVAYVLGVAAMIVPLTGLLLRWHYDIPKWMGQPNSSMAVMMIIAMWGVVCGSGLAVIGTYVLDSWLEYRSRALVAEREGEHLRREV